MKVQPPEVGAGTPCQLFLDFWHLRKKKGLLHSEEHVLRFT